MHSGLSAVQKVVSSGLSPLIGAVARETAWGVAENRGGGRGGVGMSNLKIAWEH